MLAAVLALALAGGAVPLGSVSSARSCQMPCCAGDTWTASCANGTCHLASLPPEKAEPKPTPEPHCGKSAPLADHQMHTDSVPESAAAAPASRHNAQEHFATPRHTTSHSQAHPAPGISVGSLTRPCPPDCGGAASYSNFGRGRDQGVVAYASRPRPPTSLMFARHAHAFLSTSAARYRPDGPRGPPPTFLS